jgi:hypothetical protein
MNAATRMRASCQGWRLRAGVGVLLADGVGFSGGVVASGVVVAGGVFGGAGVEDGAVWGDAAPGMIPIRYVTDRFVFLERRTGR